MAGVDECRTHDVASARPIVEDGNDRCNGLLKLVATGKKDRARFVGGATGEVAAFLAFPREDSDLGLGPLREASPRPRQEE